MSKNNLYLRVIKAGLLSVGLLTSCSDGSPSNCTADNSCIENENGSQGEKEEDSGSKTSTHRDAGGGASADAARADSGTRPHAPLDSGTLGQANGLPCDIEALIAVNCGTCHGETPAFSAPMSLVTAADFQGVSDDGHAMYELVKERTNASDPRKRMPPAGSSVLDPEQLTALNAWLDQGAPGGDCTIKPDAGSPSADGGDDSNEGLQCYRFLARGTDPNAPFKVGTAVDAYYNVTFAAPWKGTAYGVKLSPVIDNSQVIHHWLLFQDDVAGTPGGAVPSVGAHPDGQLLHGWAPGGSAIDFRSDGADVGIELPGDTTYTVEYHYNSNDPNALDASGVEVCVASKKPANIAGLSWLGYDQLGAPAETWVGTCDPGSTQPIHILSVTPHMHLQGVHMKATINRADGTKDTLHDADFDFNYQHAFRVNAVLQPGDTITTECDYAMPTAFGEGTKDEMCYLFTMAYPKGALTDDGVWGSIAHGGSACLGQ